MKTFVLIDGYAQFFRCYHAIRTPMTSPVTQEPTNMTFGFVGVLLKLLRGDGANAIRPDFLAVALDVSGDRGTFRSEIFPEYKAHRPPPPEDLRPQVDRCLALLDTVGVPVIGAEGYEADDVIASIARTLPPDVRLRIISNDKDLKQILRDGVEMYDPHKDAVTSVATLEADTGLRPEQVIDYLALMGDNVDNVPGVEGIGPKTAAQLIGEYGTLDALLADADAIKGKRGERIRAATDTLAMSKRLVTLESNLRLDFDLEDAQAEALNLGAMIPVLRDLGFNRYQDDVKDMIEGPVEDDDFGDSLFSTRADAPPEGTYTCVRTRAELDEVRKALEDADRFAIDTETTSLAPRQGYLCGVCLGVEPGAAWYVPVRSPEPDTHLDEATVLDVLRPLLEDVRRPKIGHNLKYDLLVLRRAGVELRGLTTEGGCDTMVASYLIDSSRSSHSLDALAKALLGRDNIHLSDLLGRGRSQKTFDTIPLDKATPYAGEDADVTLRLCERMEPDLREMGLDALSRDVELPLVEVLAELEWNGIQVDPDELDRQAERLNARITTLRTEIQDASMQATGRTFDPNSSKQLAGILFNAPDAQDPGLGLKPIKKTKTGFSTDAEVLDKLVTDASIESPIPALILEYRQLTKLVSTYLVSLKEAIHPETGRIHASFNQTVAATGRLSSSDPNLQNIPIRTDIGREIRRAFVARDGHVLITADYSQIELRILAHLSRDPGLQRAFHEGLDIHRAVAAEVHGIDPDDVTSEQRNGAKMVNFGIVYGITPFGLARRLGISNGEAAEIIDDYKRRFAGITTFLEECVDQARRQGWVETMLKRRRPITDIDSNNQQRRSLAERIAINSVVQGSAADLIKLAMLDLHRRLSPHASHWRDGPPDFEGVAMLLQIHDELVFEAPESIADDVRAFVVERMEQAMSLDVPLVADSHVARTWYDGK
ncbi:MAG: DNA polymerase I [Phycisphaerales bacterium]|nr:DNA polymerase I [Phycisphaerales bacterium]